MKYFGVVVFFVLMLTQASFAQVINVMKYIKENQ